MPRFFHRFQAMVGAALAAPLVFAASDDVSLYQAPLVCRAAPNIGCGSRAKPLLRELERHPAVAEARLHRSGTMLAVAWKHVPPAEEARSAVKAIMARHGMEMAEAPESTRGEALKDFPAEDAWHGSLTVDRLSQEEARIIAARLVARVRARTPLTEEAARNLEAGIGGLCERHFIGKRKINEKKVLNAARPHLSEEGMATLKDAVAQGWRPLPGEN